MDTHVKPIQPEERIAEMDIIRGVALLGIFIMNMPAFNTSFFAGADGSRAFTAWYDRGTEELREVLFSGKFNSMFSFLFAIGFTIQLGRLQASEPQRATSVYARRILILLLLGLTHAFIFWNGDVLHVYAVLGLLLLGLRFASDRWIVALLLATMVVPTIGGLLQLGHMTPEYLQQRINLAQAWEAADNQAYGHGSFAAAARQSIRGMTFAYTDRDAVWSTAKFYLEMTTTLCLGLLAGRHLWIQTASKQLARVARIQWAALGVGLAAAAVYFVARIKADPLHINALSFIGGFAYRLCRVALMAFYVTTIVRVAQLPAWRARLRPVALAGRMPLTNYLLQTALGTAIFCGWGLGFWGKAGPLVSLLLAGVLYAAIQLPLSTWWFGRFRYGPLEYCWRAATYGRLPSMRSETETATVAARA